MGKGIDYRFRVRENDGKVLVRPHVQSKEVEYDRFSLPQKAWADASSHETIRRPRFKELEGAARKYL